MSPANRSGLGRCRRLFATLAGVVAFYFLSLAGTFAVV